MTLRVLLLADTHLGFDHSLRPRVDRRRRGPDFFANTRAALAPALRGEVDLVSATRWKESEFDLRLLCLHQTVEGAVVGPQNYVFRSGPDIIPGTDLPTGFAAVLAGHIHRHQVLTHDLRRRKLAAPVFYPGSVERTSAAERDEAKGFLVIDFEPDRRTGGRVIDWEFHELPARLMIDIEIDPSAGDGAADWLRAKLASIDSDAIIRIRVSRPPGEAMREALKAASLRQLALPTQTVEVSWPRKERS